ncbi:MAG: MFS transporter [Hyphomicrobium sp.]
MQPRASLRRRRILVVSGLAHALHDGYTDLIYVMLPVWQVEFGLAYGALALLRGLYAGAMAALQIPVGRLSERYSSRTLLAFGTAISALGFALAGWSGGLFCLCAALTLAGIGSSTQHPITSAAISQAYGSDARPALGIYNFSGDIGKAAIPAATALLLTVMPWRSALWLLAAIGLACATAIGFFLPDASRRAPFVTKTAQPPGQGRGGFALLCAIGILDTGVRMAFLTFLPFLLKAKGAELSVIGLALSLVFMGGAAGKLLCGWLSQHLGVVWTVTLTEAATAAGIVAAMLLPLYPALVVLPFLGIALNGTSSALYGTVPELMPSGRTERAFAIFYTGTIGSGAIAPVLFGLLCDMTSLLIATGATAITALAIIPLVLVLDRHLFRP